jgi:hypothetical protein
LKSSSNTSWTISDNKVYYKSTFTFSSYYIYYSTSGWNSGWTVSSSSSSSCYTVDSVIVDEPVGKVTITPATQTMDEGDECNFTVESVSYTPAYNKYTFNSTSYYCSPKWENVSTTGPSPVTTASGYAWTTDASTDNVELTNETTATVTATYKTHLSAQEDKKLTATVTIPKTGSFMTGNEEITGEVTLTLTKRAKPTFSFTLPSEVYVDETVTGSLTSTSDGTITYKVDNDSYVTFTKDASDSKKFTVTGLAFPSDETSNSKLVTITASVPKTDNYLASTATTTVAVKKRPTTLAVTYDKNTLTYGDDYPTLQSCVVTDTHTNTSVSNASVSYTSNQTYAQVNNTTGEITSITKAGDFTITAKYAGDGTYAAATDVTTAFTVNKATPTLTFPDDNYFVRFTDGFPNAPTATLTLKQNDTGSVTYSCASSPEGLVTVDASTGKVTLAKVNGTMEGTATITATFAGDDKYEAVTASYGMTVSTRAIPKFSVDMENSLYVGDDTHKITVEKGGSTGTVTYESDNTAVLEVTDGKMNAKSAGTANVTVKMEGDANYIPMEATFTVTVKRYPTKLTIGSLQEEYYTDYSGTIKPTVQLIETVNNTGVSDKTYTYKSSNTSALTIDATTGEIEIKGAGQATITVAFEGDDKYEGSHDTWKITVKRTAMKGDFIRIKNADGNYLTASADGSNVEWATTTDEDASNIIYYGKNDGSLLFYQCGRYISDATTTPALASVGDKGYTGTAFTLERTNDTYTISAGSSNTTDLTVEIVKSLPVTFKDAGHGYSTLYCPVDLRCTAGVTAYYATARTADDAVDYIITLKEVLRGEMPANTPFVLKASDITTVKTYNFYISDETQTIDKDSIWSGLAGTLPTINTLSVYDDTQCPYTLQPTSSSASTISTVPVGFYPWKSDKHTTIDPFRCYIPGSSVSQAKGFRFAFDGGETSGIMTIDGGSSSASSTSSSSSSSLIYNLQGVCVGNDINALPAGVYVRGGKKMVKK